MATRFSGNVDFMAPGTAELLDYKLVPVRDDSGIYAADDQTWADPNFEQLVEVTPHQGHGELEEPLQRQAVVGDDLVERVALHVFHGQEVSAVGLLERVQHDDVGMRDRSNGAGLSLEALPTLGIFDGPLG